MLFAILFSSLYSRPPSWRASLRSLKRALYPSHQSYSIGEVSQGLPSVLVANTVDAPHYRQIINSISSLFEKNNISTLNLCKKWARTSIQEHISVLLSFMTFFIWFIVKLNPSSRQNWSHVLRSLPKMLHSYKEVKINQDKISIDLRKLQGVVVINEDWLPTSSLIKYAEENDVKTIHYPHGIIGKVNLPLISDVQLFWNEEMKSYFCINESCYSIGFLEMYGLVAESKKQIPKDPFEFDILVTSQIHASHKDDRFSKVFELISNLDQSKKICVKMHPFDSKKDKSTVEHMMRGGACDYKIYDADEASLQNLLRRSKTHVTVSSGSIVVANKLSVPNLLYGKSEQLEINGVSKGAEFFENVSELEEAIKKTVDYERPKWVKNNYIKHQFQKFVHAEIKN